MRRFLFCATALTFWGLRASCVLAGVLGTAGPFHSVGGASCEAGGTSDEACGVPPIDVSAPAKQQATQQITRARRFFDLLRMKDAWNALEQAIDLDPDNVDALTLRGRAALSEGDLANAEANINAALKIAPNEATLLATKAFMEHRVSLISQGLKDADRAIELAPDDIDIRWIRSTIYMSLKRPDLAFGDLSIILAKDPENDRARQSRSQILLQTKNFPAAVHDATLLLARNPNDIDAHQVRGDASVELGDDATALSDLDYLVGPGPLAAPRRATPSFQPYMVKRAGALLRLKRQVEAKAAIDEFLKDGGMRAILHMQIYLQANGFPNLIISGTRSDAFDIAVASCFADRACGPRILP